jgi:hypothetical protein
LRAPEIRDGRRDLTAAWGEADGSIGGNVVERAAAFDTEGREGNNGVAGSGRGRRVALLDEEPVLLPVVRLFPPADSDQHPAAPQFFAVEREFEPAVAQRRRRVGVGWNPGAAIPEHDRSAAVFVLWNDPLETAIFERMIFDFDREPLFTGIEARSFRHCPALEHAIEFETKIIVEPARRMLLDDEGQRARGLAWPRRGPGRFRGFAKVAFLSVFFERHSVDRLWARFKIPAGGPHTTPRRRARFRPTSKQDTSASRPAPSGATSTRGP